MVRKGRWLGRMLVAFASVAGSASTPAAATDQPPPAAPAPGGPAVQMPEVVVRGRAEDLLGVAASASEGAVGGADLEDLPILRRGELLESVPGMVVTQHSGDGKANQYFLRGFNLDHGTDFAFSIDGVPVNLPTHAHGQGYSDLNFLIPELVDVIEYKKGPFYPEVGDFSGAGAANIHMVRTLPEGIANLQLGQYGYSRALLADSPQLGPGTLLYALELNHYDGPWDLPENSNRYNGLLRYHWGSGADEYNVTAGLYWAPQWHSTDQVAQRAISDGLIGRFGAIDPTDGGRTGRGALSFDWTRHDGGTTTNLLLYAFYYQLNLWSDFDYALTDPVHLDQFEQIDRRVVGGGELKRAWDQSWWGKRVRNTLGVQVRNDYIPTVGLDDTQSRQVLDVEIDDRVEEAHAGVYGDNQVQWTSWFKSELGLRADVFGVDVDSSTNAANSGSAGGGIVSPKASLVFGPWKKTELYVNAGAGFHSNDARGVTITVDSMGTAEGRVPLLVRTKGAEVGARTSILPGLVTTLSFWILESSSELTFDGDSGDTEANGPSRRYGIEWANFYKPTRWLTLSADFTFSHARYLDPQETVTGTSGLYIANAIPVVISAAAVVETPSGVFGGARLRYFSSQPVIEDDSERQPESTIVNAMLGYRFGRYEISVEVLNLFDSKADDIAYDYPSRLPDSLLATKGLPPEPAAGVEGLVIHPVEPLQVRGSLTAHF
jgi:TonB-dependent Receptor Plug Domain